MFYLYEHIRPDTNLIFYVGKGSFRRMHSKHRRNAHWNNIVKKSGGYQVRQVFAHNDEELIFLAEQERISQLTQLGLKLANKTGGGEGPSGMRHTEEAKRKIAEAQIGEKHWTVNHVYTEEQKAKLRFARSKFVYTDEIRAKISEAGKRRVYTDETRLKMSKSKQNGKHPMANMVEFDGKIFSCIKELAEYTGRNYSTLRDVIKRCPEKFGFKLLGYTKDLKGK